MNSQALSAGLRTIGWNGLQFTLPDSWDVVVSGPRHLLIECNFEPVLEMRWDSGGKSSLENVVATARQRFADVHQDVRRTSPPPPLAPLCANRGITCLAWHDGDYPDGLLWQCPECQTVVLCQLFSHQPGMLLLLAAALESFQCHQPDGAPSLWSIQDFQLILPPGFNFLDSTFAAGLSRLAFSRDGVQLQFCRLAPAATRLAAHSLPQLLGTMLGEPLPDHIITNTTELYECRNTPSTSRQILSRLRRLQPFRWGRIWHDAVHNRLLSVTAESRRVIDLNLVHDLCIHYEIVPLNCLETTVNKPS